MPSLLNFLKSIVNIVLFTVLATTLLSQTGVVTGQWPFDRTFYFDALYVSLLLAIDIAIARTLIRVVDFVDRQYLRIDWNKGLLWEAEFTYLVIFTFAVVAQQADAIEYIKSANPLA